MYAGISEFASFNSFNNLGNESLITGGVTSCWYGSIILLSVFLLAFTLPWFKPNNEALLKYYNCLLWSLVSWLSVEFCLPFKAIWDRVKFLERRLLVLLQQFSTLIQLSYYKKLLSSANVLLGIIILLFTFSLWNSPWPTLSTESWCKKLCILDWSSTGAILLLLTTKCCFFITFMFL